jgi:hypothetical protein
VSDLTAVLLVVLLGAYALLLGFVALMFRLGRFTLLPGERTRLIGVAGFGLTVSLLMPFIAPFMPTGIGFGVILLVGSLALFAIAVFQSRHRGRLSDSSAAEVAERERRRAFMRTGRFMGLTFAFVVAMVVWATAVVILTR